MLWYIAPIVRFIWSSRSSALLAAVAGPQNCRTRWPFWQFLNVRAIVSGAVEIQVLCSIGGSSMNYLIFRTETEQLSTFRALVLQLCRGLRYSSAPPVGASPVCSWQ